MKLCTSILLGMVGCVLAAGLQAAEPIVKGPTDDGPRIELAILLDTSGSMDGLIDQARTRLWAIVNDLATTKKDGKVPDLRVALYQYGASQTYEKNGYVRQVKALTDDLDAISEALWSLRTAGSLGKEYCGQAIAIATADESWSTEDDYRAIFIAGNETFKQGGVDFKDAVKKAVGKGIVVNTIHCGDAATGQKDFWTEAAKLGDGEAINIDQAQQEVVINTPQDKRLLELNKKLNDTYVSYGGKTNALKKQRQLAQDSLAENASPASIQSRVQSKCSSFYSNAGWDLVDGCNDKVIKIEDLADEELPEAMRGKTAEEKKAYVDGLAKQRLAIQEEIKEANKKRDAYIAAEKAKRGEEAASDDFASAVRQALDVQLESKGYQRQSE